MAVMLITANIGVDCTEHNECVHGGGGKVQCQDDPFADGIGTFHSPRDQLGG